MIVTYNKTQKTTDMKNLIALIILIATTLTTQAQMPYDFKYKKEAYVPLTNGISLNDTNIWDDESYAIPLGFTFKLGNKTIDTVYLHGMSLLSSDTALEIMDGLVFIDADLEDRGAIDTSQSKSPIRYEITGTKGNQICKIEMANAGLHDERDIYNTMDDYINIQLWIYEAGGIVEMHYGPSQITYAADYFLSQTGPIVGYADYFDPNEQSGMVYLVSGDYDSPILDSFSFTTMGFTLYSYPDDGTVYTFTPKKKSGLGISKSDLLQNIQVYPTAVHNNLHVNLDEHTGAAYRIISATGQITNVYGSMNQRHSIIDVSNLSSGMYILQMNIDNEVGAYRFSKL